MVGLERDYKKLWYSFLSELPGISVSSIPARLALRAHPETFAENSLQHLARGAFRQLRFGKVDSTRNLIVRDELPAVRDQLVRGELRPSLQDHTGRHQFSPCGIWNTENCYLPDGRMIKDYALHLARIDVFTTGDDHIFRTV